MDSNKLEISGAKTNGDSPAVQVTYMQIPEQDMEDEALSRPKSLVKVKTSSEEADGADEKMLPDEDTKVTVNSNMDRGDVKTPPADKQNGDAKLDIEDLKSQIVGMTKEELMKYANDPFWIRIRWFLFITFWLLWAAMLLGAILIIYAAPKCNPPSPKTWCQQGPIAELPLENQQETLEYIDKNIKGVILTWPEDTYASFNDSHEFIKLIKESKSKNLGVIVELAPAVSNIWFDESESSSAEFKEYYIWKKSETATPPNNWKSPNNESSWKFSTQRNEYYYSPFTKPHLNFRNNDVIQQFSKVIENFIKAGASGIRIQNASFLLVDSNWGDESQNLNAIGTIHDEYDFYTHSKTQNLNELGPLLYKWRKVVKNLTEDGPFIVAGEFPTNLEAYKYNGTLVVDLPLSTIFSKPTFLVNATTDSLNYTLTYNDWPLWEAKTAALPKDVLNIITYLLPGTPLAGYDEAFNDTLSEHLLKLRESPSIMRGDCNVYNIRNSVLVFSRNTTGNPGVLVAVNPSDETVDINIPVDIPPLSKTADVTVQLFSSKYKETKFKDINKKHDSSNIPILGKSAIALSYVPPKANE